MAVLEPIARPAASAQAGRMKCLLGRVRDSVASLRQRRPLASGGMPGIRVATDAHFWYERFGPDARWADFRSSDPEYEYAVGIVSHLQGTRFLKFHISTDPDRAAIHCMEIGNEPVGELPSFRSTWWPSLDAALRYAGGHSRIEPNGLPVQVFLNGRERLA